MSSQKVFRLSALGTHHNLEEREEPIPVIDKNEVLVKIRAVALNYRDTVIADGVFPFPVKADLIPCSDASGEVVEVGSSVLGLQVGDRVIGNFDRENVYGPQSSWDYDHGGSLDGFLRQYVSLPYTAITKIPSHANLTFPQMSALVASGVTSWNALYGSIPLKPGQTVLFQGTGGVSTTGLLFAKAAGAVTIITSSSDSKLDYVKAKFGVDHVINYKTTPDWASVANKITQGRGVDYIFENGGSGTIKQSIECVAYGGIISVIGFLSIAKQEDMPDVAMLSISKGCIIRGILVGSKLLAEEMVRFVAAKGIQPPVEKVFDFSREGVIAGYDYLKSGAHIGKVCIDLN